MGSKSSRSHQLCIRSRFAQVVVLVFQLLVVLLGLQLARAQTGDVSVGMNYGRVAFDVLKASIAVDVMQKNGIKKVKLFNADPTVLEALSKGKGFTDVMVTVKNQELQEMAASVENAEKWVHHNVKRYVDAKLVPITCVAVGNEPFLAEVYDDYKDILFPALENIVTALTNKGLIEHVKVTVPFNADVANNTEIPSQGKFKDANRLGAICTLLNQTRSYFTVNIYPFYMLKDTPSIPVPFVMFEQTEPGGYSSLLDKAYDGIVAALGDIGFGNMKVVLGEVGWPTDGHFYATREMARRFNQACIKHLLSAKGTVLRPRQQIDAYMFALFDEDAKSIHPGPFERHWGIFDYAGRPKYNLDFTGRGLDTQLHMGRTPDFQKTQWCIAPKPYDLLDPNGTRDRLEPILCPKDELNYTLKSDCSTTVPNASCYFDGDTRKILNVWMNNIYQLADQDEAVCKIDGKKGQIVQTDPSEANCSFHRALDPSMLDSAAVARWGSQGSLMVLGSTFIWSLFTICLVVVVL